MDSNRHKMAGDSFDRIGPGDGPRLRLETRAENDN